MAGAGAAAGTDPVGVGAAGMDPVGVGAIPGTDPVGAGAGVAGTDPVGAGAAGTDLVGAGAIPITAMVATVIIAVEEDIMEVITTMRTTHTGAGQIRAYPVHDPIREQERIAAGLM